MGVAALHRRMQWMMQKPLAEQSKSAPTSSCSSNPDVRWPGWRISRSPAIHQIPGLALHLSCHGARVLCLSFIRDRNLHYGGCFGGCWFCNLNPRVKRFRKRRPVLPTPASASDAVGSPVESCSHTSWRHQVPIERRPPGIVPQPFGWRVRTNLRTKIAE